jgi:hypothetical protein
MGSTDATAGMCAVTILSKPLYQVKECAQAKCRGRRPDLSLVAAGHPPPGFEVTAVSSIKTLSICIDITRLFVVALAAKDAAIFLIAMDSTVLPVSSSTPHASISSRWTMRSKIFVQFLLARS